MRSILRWNRLTNDHRRSAIVLEARAGEHGGEALDHGVELGLDGVRLGQRARIGLVLAEAVAVEGELVKQVRGGRGDVMFAIGVGVAGGKDAAVV